MTGKIFINYRRDDRQPHAIILRDRLVPTYGADKIFMDVANLLPGEHFAERLAKELDGCDVLLAVIGPSWLPLLQDRAAKGERDYVREEITTALRRRIIVVPVLVDGAELPAAEQLPDDIRDLVFYQKHTFSIGRADLDAAELMAAIAKVRKKNRIAAAATTSTGTQGTTERSRSPLMLGAALVAVVAVSGAVYVVQVVMPQRAPPSPIVRDEARIADDAAIAKAREGRSIAAYEAYLTEIGRRIIQGRHRDEARRAIADLELWERTDKTNEAALTTYLASTPSPIMAPEARALQIKLAETAEREACTTFTRTALAHAAEAAKLSCAVSGDLWSSRESVQSDECLALRTPEARQKRTAERADLLGQCTRDRAEAAAWATANAKLAELDASADKAAKSPPPKGIDPIEVKLDALRRQIGEQEAVIAVLDRFLADNPNGAGGRLVGDATAQRDDRRRQIAALHDQRLTMDRKAWAAAEKTPLEAKGFEAYRTLLPEGERRVDADRAIADLAACNAAIDTDDVDAMKAYRAKFSPGRCDAKIAALIAPPTDLTAARLVVLDKTPAEAREERELAEAEKKRKPGEKRLPARTKVGPHPVSGLLFDASKALAIVRGAELLTFDLVAGKPVPPSRWEIRNAGVSTACSVGPETDSPLAFHKAAVDCNQEIMNRWKQLGGFVRGVFDTSSQSWIALFDDVAPGYIQHGRDTYAWFESGAIKVQKAGSDSPLRSIVVKEKGANPQVISLSPDGKWLASIVSWDERQNGRRLCPEDSLRCDSIGLPTAHDIKTDLRIYNIERGTLDKQTTASTRRSQVATPGAFVSGEVGTSEILPSKPEKVAIEPTALHWSEGHLLVAYSDGTIRPEYNAGSFVLKNLRATSEGYQINHMLALADQKRILIETSLHGMQRASPKEPPSKPSKDPTDLSWLDDSIPLPPKPMPFSIISTQRGRERAADEDILERPTDPPARWKVTARAISPDESIFAAAVADKGSTATIHLWHIPSRRYLGWIRLLQDGSHVAARADGTFTAPGAAQLYLMVEIGKRRWPLADVPAFADRFFRKDGVDLLASPK